MNKAQSDAAVQMMKDLRLEETLDVDRCLATIAQIRSWIPELDHLPEPAGPEEGRLSFSPLSAEEFDHHIALEAVLALIEDINQIRARNLARSVAAYYEIEDDPVQCAEFRSEIESLHQAHWELYGKPVPPNPKKNGCSS